MRIALFKSLTLAIVLAAWPVRANAQVFNHDSVHVAAAEAPDTARRNLVLVNPFGVVFDVYSLEYEHVMSKGTSIGLASTYYKPSDYTYFTSEVKLRYYPSDHAPDGLSVALSGGVTHETTDLICFDVCNATATNRPTLGFDLDYNWLLGPSRRFTIGTGIGAKRLFGSKTYSSIDGIPTARIAIGAAF